MQIAPNLAAPLLPSGDLAGLPRNPKDAAEQFESLLLTQMLREARVGDSEDQTAETMWDMAAQQFAQTLSKSGGLGLARLIQSGLQAGPGLEHKP